MPSTYTTNLGIEKPATGEQSGTWGDTVNLNYDLFDQAINGVQSVTLPAAGSSGSPRVLAITDGTVSEGRNKFIEFVDGGDLGATAYVQLTPNDAEKVVHIRNSLSGNRAVIVFQGTYNASNDFEIPNGKDVVLKFDGAGSGAVVGDVFVDLQATALTTPSLTATGGTLDGVVIGGASAAAATVTDLTASGTVTLPASTIASTDAGAAVGPVLTLHRDSASPADADVIGGVDFDGEDDGGNQTTYARINAEIADVTDGTEDGDLVLSTMNAGTLSEAARISAGGVFVVGRDTSPGIAGETYGSFGAGSGASRVYILAGSSSSANLHFGDTTDPDIGAITYDNATDKMSFETNDSVRAVIDSSGNVGIGTASPGVTLDVSSGVVNNDIARLYGTSASRGLVISSFAVGGINEVGFDFDAPGAGGSDGTITLSTSGSERIRVTDTGNVGIGTASPSAPLHAVGDDNNAIIIAESTDADATQGPIFLMYRSSASPADGDELGAMFFRGRNDASQDVDYAVVRAEALDVTDGTEDGALEIDLVVNGVASTRARLTPTGLGIGTTSPAEKLDVVGNAKVSGETYSVTGTTSVPSATWTTIRSFSATDIEQGMVTVFFGGTTSGLVGAYNKLYDGGASSGGASFINRLDAADVRISGNNLQVYHNTGTTVTASWYCLITRAG